MVTTAMKLRHLLPGRKAMTNLDSVLRSRDITLLQRSVQLKLWFFQWSCKDVDSWTIKTAEHRRTDVLNCGAGEDCSESLRLQGDPISQS